MNKIKPYQLITTLSFVFVLVSCTAIYEDGSELAKVVKKGVPEISVEELNAKLEGEGEFLLIDVQIPRNYSKHNIPGSFNISAGQLEFDIGSDDYWEKEYMYAPMDTTEIIICSEVGDRGILATKSLMAVGYKNVKNLAGGIQAYDHAQEL